MSFELYDDLQAAYYEALQHLGPIWSAVFAGYATADWRFSINITPAGLRYLQRQN